MPFGPVFQRELLTSSRRKRTFLQRVFTGLSVLAVILLVAVVCDYNGRDRTSLDGVRWFALMTFGLVVGLQVVSMMGTTTSIVAPLIARERDKKSLDALLATELSGYEIVVGAMTSGMVRCLADLASVFPILVMLIPFWGLDPRLLLVSYVALGSFTFALAGIAVSMSVHSPTARRAVSASVVLITFWAWFPLPVLIILPRLWSAGAAWVSPVALVMLDTSPTVLVANMGVVVRGTFNEVLARMIVYQVVIGIACTVWAIVRLRPASRALYDVEGETLLKRAARLAPRRSRPPCGDDPVFWHEAYAIPMISLYERILGAIVRWSSFVVYVVGIYWFAQPAYLELASSGYGAAETSSTSLDMHPFVRLLINGRSSMPTPGQARLELAMLIRQISAVSHIMAILMIGGAVSQSLIAEKEQDTWLGLIATPLSGKEILRGKMLGAIWKFREILIATLVLLLIGLTSGALHPLGILAATVNLTMSCWLLAALGARATLWVQDRSAALNRTILPGFGLSFSAIILLFLPTTVSHLSLGIACPPFLTWLSLVSYEEATEMIRSGRYPAVAVLGLDAPPAAWWAVVTILMGITLQGIVAAVLTRSAFRAFDAAAGRPIRKASIPPEKEEAFNPVIGVAVSRT